jgi:hypothetical protein
VIKTWKTSTDPLFEEKKNRVLCLYDIADGKVKPKRSDPAVVICMDEFGPLNLLPRPGKQWAPQVVKGQTSAAPRRRLLGQRGRRRPHLVHRRDSASSHVQLPRPRRRDVDQVRTDKWWFHVVSNELYTYLFASPTRAKSAPDEAGVLPEFAGVMVHDRLAMYFKYKNATHAICLAHILRELEPIGIRWDQGWANDMTALLTEMNNAAHDARSTGATRLSPSLLQDFSRSLRQRRRAGPLGQPRPAQP